MKIRKEDEDDFEYLEEGGKHDTVLMVIRLVLLIVALVLCLVIWKLSQSDGDEAQGSEVQGSEVQPVETLTETILTEDTREMGNAPSSDSAQSETGNAQPQDSEAQQLGSTDLGPNDTQETDSVAMTFQDVDEIVTAKELTNLRSEPSTARDDTVVAKLKNGQTVRRTGINEDTGWSRLEYEGQTLYAANSLLTTDLTGNGTETDIPTGADAQAGADTQTGTGVQPAAGGSVVVNGDTVTTISGRTITFTPCDDTISPKMEVNLRGEPSTDQGNDTIHYRMMYGETAHRTGYDEASGWSRVEYNGEVLYVVTSYIYVVEDVQSQQE
ncbi:MAG: SH3 domain-containing protein [Lachnospiraceae bacterium]